MISQANRFKSARHRDAIIDPGGSTLSSKSGIITSLVIIVIVFGAVGGILLTTNQYQPPRIAVVTLEPGFGDLNRDDNARQGMDDISVNYSVQYYIPEELPSTVAEAETLMEELAESGNYMLILAIGSDLESAVESVAAQYPQQRFAILGAAVNADNVASATFATEQAAFLSGVLAAFLANEQPYFGTTNFTGEIGILSGVVGNPITDDLIAGFIQGVEAANETYDLNVGITQTLYVGSWNDTTTAEVRTYTMFVQQNISLIFAPVRASMPGVRTAIFRAEAAFPIQQRNAGRLPLVIASGANLDYYGTADPGTPTAPSYIATSVVPHFDWAVYDIVDATLWDRFPGGEVFEYTLANGGANITAFTYSSTYISDESTEAISEYIDLIVEGTIEVTP
jgi:basic membrane protein A